MMLFNSAVHFALFFYFAYAGVDAAATAACAVISWVCLAAWAIICEIRRGRG